MKRTILFLLSLLAMSNICFAQENIEDFVDVSNFNNYMDWHYDKIDIPWPEEPEEYATMKMPDWVLYAAAQTAVPPHDLLSIFCGKWNEKYIYWFSNLWETMIFYNEDGNWLGKSPHDFASIEFHHLGDYETKAEAFDPTSMFGKRINNRLVGIWKREITGTNGSPDYTAYMEFRSNGSGHTWRVENGVKKSGSRFLYTIEEGPKDLKSKDWVVVKKVTEGKGLTKYVNYVVEGDSMYNVGDYDFPRDDKSVYYHRVIRDELSANDVNIEPGKTAKLEIGLKNANEYVLALFDLILPEGITIANDDEGKYAVELSRWHKKNFADVVPIDGGYRILIMDASGNKTIAPGEGTMATITLQASADAKSGTGKIIADGEADGSKTQGFFTDNGEAHYLKDVEFKINVNGGAKSKKAAADVNGDGVVNAADIVEIINIIMTAE